MVGKRRIRLVYFFAMLLATGLFAFHAIMLIETSRAVVFLIPWLDGMIGRRFGDPLVVFASFGMLFIIHMIEGFAWAKFFVWIGEFPDLQQAVYFCGTSLTTLGYGDVVLRPPWKRLGPILAANGILLYGCSTAFLFLVIQKIWEKTGVP